MINHDRFDVQPSYFALARTLCASLLERERATPTLGLVVGIAGESGSGKSITATCLARELDGAGRRARVIHQDDYFRLPPRSNHEHRLLDLAHVGPHEVNLELLRTHIADFRAKRDNISVPLVDYPGNRFVTERCDFGQVDVLLVEGTYVLQLPDLDLRIFLEATHHDTSERRRARNRDIDAPIIDRILDIEHAIIARQSVQADILIDRDFAIVRSS